MPREVSQRELHVAQSGSLKPNSNLRLDMLVVPARIASRVNPS